MSAIATFIEGDQAVRPGVFCERGQELDSVVFRYLPMFYKRAFRFLGNVPDAEDAVQDALLSAYTHLDQFNGGAQMSTWLTTIVINSARMQLRKRSRHIQASLDEPFGDEQQNFVSEQIADDSASPEDLCRESELHARVRQLLTQLSAPLRKAFQLRDVDGLTTHEAAILLGVPDGTVKAQLARARARLRELMRPPLDAKPTSVQTGTRLTLLASTVRDQDRRVLRGQIPVTLEANRKVA